MMVHTGKDYFDHDSGLASNFINFIRAEGPVVVCMQ